MRILLTGGTGFIGSHTAVRLFEKGHDVIIADNLSNSSMEVNGKIKEITGKSPSFYLLDIRDEQPLRALFSQNNIDAVIHFAGLKAVGESAAEPLKYYENNIGGTLMLLKVMKDFGCRKIIFSSSATVYGEENDIPYVETMKRGTCSNPYGWTKAMIEQIIEDMVSAGHLETAILLRYFNPVGAHPSGLIGEDPRGVPNNLMPYITQVAAGMRDRLTIFGNDYDTPDGTCRRDYLHIMDLAKGHVAAVEYAEKSEGTEIFNLGTGNPVSVLEMVNAFEKATGMKVPYVFGERREGDLPQFWADPEKAKEVLGWQAIYSLEDMCRDAWKYQSNNI